MNILFYRISSLGMKSSLLRSWRKNTQQCLIITNSYSTQKMTSHEARHSRYGPWRYPLSFYVYLHKAVRYIDAIIWVYHCEISQWFETGAAKLSFQLVGNAIAFMGIVQGAVSIRKTVLPGMAIPMLKIRRPNGRLIFNMEIAIRR